MNTANQYTLLQLNLQTAPVLLFFPPTTGEFAASDAEPKRFDFSAGYVDLTPHPVHTVYTDMADRTPSAEQARDWLVRHTPGRAHPAFSRPIDWVKNIIFVTGILFTVSFVYTFYPWIEWVVTRKAPWKIIALAVVILSISGHWFNSIRGTQYAGQDGKGKISYIAAGFQTQYQLESQIIAVACKQHDSWPFFFHCVHFMASTDMVTILDGLLALSALALADKVPRIANSSLQTTAIIAWGGFMLIGYSLLMSIFRIKNGGYPFTLPPFF